MGSQHKYDTSATGSYQAQHGEDRWLEHYFLGIQDGVFVEVGAYDGIVLSNTFFLESIGWTGVLVEPVPEKAEKCRINRPRSLVFECAAVGSDLPGDISFHEVIDGGVYSTSRLSKDHSARLERYGLHTRTLTVRARTLDSMLEEAQLKRVDFVSIDVEGAEVDVLSGFTLARWRPRVVMIEVNSRTRSAEIRDKFVRAGYVYFASVEINDVYVPLQELPGLALFFDRARYWSHQAGRALRWSWGKARRLARPKRSNVLESSPLSHATFPNLSARSSPIAVRTPILWK
jgi:FkbM family methyltransferase